MKKVLALILSGSLLQASLLFAQTPPPDLPPASSDAEVLAQKAQEQADEELSKEPKPVVFKTEAPAETPRSASNQPFFLDGIDLEGNQVIPTLELRPFITPFEGREVTLNELNQLAKQLEQEYRGRGYITTIVYIPPQKIENKRLIMKVLEGRMGKLFIEGNKWFKDKAIRRYWKVKENEIFHYKKAARNLQAMNGNPDRQVKIILRPGEIPGATDVHLNVKDRFPGHLLAQYDNQGTESTGKQRAGLTVRHNNFLFYDSLFLIGTFLGKNFASAYSQYVVPVNSFGSKLVLGFSLARVSPKGEFKSADIEGISKTYSAAFRQTLLETEHVKGHFNIGMDFKDSKTKTVQGTVRRERLRLLRLGLNFRQQDSRGATALSNELSFGLKGLGASQSNNPLSGRQGAKPNLIKLHGTATRSLVLPFNTQAVANLEYQLTDGKLSSSEQFFMGGANSVRGYPEGDFMADQGYVFTLEYLTPFFIAPADFKLPFSKLPLREQIQFVAFLDQAYGDLKEVSGINALKSRTLFGVGGGIRVRLYENIYARMEVGHVLGEEPLTESEHTRMHLSVQTEI